MATLWLCCNGRPSLQTLNIVSHDCRENGLMANNNKVYFAIRVGSQEEPILMMRTGHKEHSFAAFESKVDNHHEITSLQPTVLCQSSSEYYSSCENKKLKKIQIFISLYQPYPESGLIYNVKM